MYSLYLFIIFCHKINDYRKKEKYWNLNKVYEVHLPHLKVTRPSVKSNVLIKLNLFLPVIPLVWELANGWTAFSVHQKDVEEVTQNFTIYICLSIIIYRLLSEYRQHEDFISRPSVYVLCVRGKHCLSGGWLLVTQLVGSLVLAGRKGDYSSVLFVISLLLIMTRILRNLYSLLKFS